jgi:hypothetical protein
MANKARYYGLATKEERQDVTKKDRASRIYPKEFGYTAVVTAILNYKDNYPNFDELNSARAANRIAGELTRTGLYGEIHSENARIVGDNYSISLTRANGLITVNKKSEQTDFKKKKRGRV